MFAHSIHYVLKHVVFSAASFSKALKKIPAILSNVFTGLFPLRSSGRLPMGLQPVPVKTKPRKFNGVR
jgi:hypothetical protein